MYDVEEAYTPTLHSNTENMYYRHKHKHKHDNTKFCMYGLEEAYTSTLQSNTENMYYYHKHKHKHFHEHKQINVFSNYRYFP